MAVKWEKTDLLTIAEKKNKEVNEANDKIIYAGIDVELSNGTKHFSLTLEDQANLKSMFDAVTWGATEYPYHADGESCVVYSAADIMKIFVACNGFITKQTTYCNMLHTWIRRETDNQTIHDIYYGIDLPEDLQAEMENLLQVANTQIQNIVARMQASYTNL